MRIGRYSIYYYGQLVEKVWSLNKACELISNMIQLGYKKDGFEIKCLCAGLGW